MNDKSRHADVEIFSTLYEISKEAKLK